MGESGKTRLAEIFARFADGGHQCIVFTAHRGFAEHIRALGGQGLAMNPSHYYQARYRESWHEPPTNINRELDTAWRETYGLYDNPYYYRPAPPVDSYPTGDSYDYDLSLRQADCRECPPSRNYEADLELPSRAARGPASPFFLTEASPVDQAPSIDAVAAERLRAQGISTVGQLLKADPQWVSRHLQLADVTPHVVIRWQDEASLVCGVPQLRNFDARVLVGCGFTDPSQLARMHPGHLLEKVEAFLATDRGQQILRTGTSYELSRITSWIAAANRSVARAQRHGSRNRNRTSSSTNIGGRDAQPSSSTGRASYAASPQREPRDRASRDRDYAANSARRSSRTAVELSGNTTPTRGDAETREYERRQRRLRMKKERRQQRLSTSHSGSPSFQRTHQRETSSDSTQSSTTLRFYLEMESPIVDAPSIGPKTASRLEAIGYRTVRQFLAADAGSISTALNHRRLTRELLETWQRQSRLMCQVPMLRGHDVQLLVAAGIDTPQQLASSAAESLLSKVDRIARSSEGKRILRGAGRPDLAEVKDWIRWAGSSRALKAA